MFKMKMQPVIETYSAGLNCLILSSIFFLNEEKGIGECILFRLTLWRKISFFLLSFGKVKHSTWFSKYDQAKYLVNVMQ